MATAYLLTMAIGTVLAGRIGDMLGRKPLHLAALVVFLGGSAWAGLASGMTEFVCARAVQGFGAGLALTTVIAIVADIAPPQGRAKYGGLLAEVAGSGRCCWSGRRCCRRALGHAVSSGTSALFWVCVALWLVALVAAAAACVPGRRAGDGFGGSVEAMPAGR